MGEGSILIAGAMPFTHKISEKEQAAHIVAQGPINLRESIAAIHALASNPDFKNHFGIFVDLREMKYTPTTMDLFGVRDVLAGLRHRFQGGITLIVAEADLYLARLACVIVNTVNIEMQAVTTEYAPRGSGHHQ
ncbi:MAG TPA: hypothetical protein VI758_04930 [Bacteroidota bacterium]